MDVQDIYLKKGPFKQLTMSEMHVLDAVNKESSPSMSAVANHLNITLGTLTTAVKKIIKKGFLIKEQSKHDQRIYYLRLTESGKEALKIHEQFHKELENMYKNHIPDDQLDWVFNALKQIHTDLVLYRNELLKK
ncbi:MAG: MarR family winged helix-turn-helix transcriptional regulator [Faecalibacillus sp.]